MASYPLEIIYAAEARAVAGSSRKFPSINSMRDYLNYLWYSDWFEREFPAATLQPVPVLEARSSTARYSLALCEEGVIAVANNEAHRTMATLLHELAHILTPGHDHDALWRSVFAKLARRELGFQTYVNLTTEFSRLTEVPS